VPAGRVVDHDDGSPIASVVVSDGLAVTRSAADGTFALPERDDVEFVWACVPSTHRALEPGWFVDVRGGVPAAIDLVLAKRDEFVADGCRFVQVTDVHVSVDDGARLRPMIESNVTAPPGVRVTGEVSGAESSPAGGGSAANTGGTSHWCRTAIRTRRAMRRCRSEKMLRRTTSTFHITRRSASPPGLGVAAGEAVLRAMD